MTARKEHNQREALPQHLRSKLRTLSLRSWKSQPKSKTHATLDMCNEGSSENEPRTKKVQVEVYRAADSFRKTASLDKVMEKSPDETVSKLLSDAEGASTNILSEVESARTSPSEVQPARTSPPMVEPAWKTPLLLLPVELIQYIVSYFNTASVADMNSIWALRLSCHSLHAIIPAPEWRLTAKQLVPYMKKALIASHLEYCHECKLYHPQGPRERYTFYNLGTVRCLRFLRSGRRPEEKILGHGYYVCACCSARRVRRYCKVCRLCEVCTGFHFTLEPGLSDRLRGNRNLEQEKCDTC